MLILTIALGVLLILGGISCIATPIITFLEAGYFLVIILFVYGIIGIVTEALKKNFGVNFWYSILSVIIGAVIIMIPGFRLMTDAVVLYIMAVWFIIKGIISIWFAIKTKNKFWICEIIIGVLNIVLGIYSFAHPLVLAFTAGVLIGLYFIMSGFDLIAASLVIKKVEE